MWHLTELCQLFMPQFLRIPNRPTSFAGKVRMRAWGARSVFCHQICCWWNEKNHQIWPFRHIPCLGLFRMFSVSYILWWTFYLRCMISYHSKPSPHMRTNQRVWSNRCQRNIRSAILRGDVCSCLGERRSQLIWLGMRKIPPFNRESL